jgi:hypothetical protein
MLELLPRVPFGPVNDPAQCAPWPQSVSAFNLAWLKGVFTPAQRDRLASVTDAINAATTQIEKARSQAVNPIEVGNRLPNGTVLRTANDAQLEHTVRTHAAKQVVGEIIKIRNATDPIIVPILKDMARASLTADTLRQRVFDKLSCLSRASLQGLDRAAFAALKANYAAILKDLAPIELTAYAQRAIDDGSAESLALLDSIRLENFRRKKDDRAFLNARLVELVIVPEFNEAGPLLDEVQTANQTALKMHAQFHDHSAHARVMKMTSGLGKLGQQVHPIGAE